MATILCMFIGTHDTRDVLKIDIFPKYTQCNV